MKNKIVYRDRYRKTTRAGIERGDKATRYNKIGSIHEMQRTAPLNKKVMGNLSCHKSVAKIGPNTPLYLLKYFSKRNLKIAICCGSNSNSNNMHGIFNKLSLFTSQNVIKNRKQDGLYYPKETGVMGHMTQIGELGQVELQGQLTLQDTASWY